MIWNDGVLCCLGVALNFVHPLRGGGFEIRPYHASPSRCEGEVLPLPLDVQGGIEGGLETLR